MKNITVKDIKNLMQAGKPNEGAIKQFGENDSRKFDSQKHRWVDADIKAEETPKEENYINEIMEYLNKQDINPDYKEMVIETSKENRDIAVHSTTIGGADVEKEWEQRENFWKDYYSASSIGRPRYYDKGKHRIYLLLSGEIRAKHKGDIGAKHLNFTKNTTYDELELIHPEKRAYLIPKSETEEPRDFARVMLNTIIAKKTSEDELTPIITELQKDKNTARKIDLEFEDYLLENVTDEEFEDALTCGIPNKWVDFVEEIIRTEEVITKSIESELIEQAKENPVEHLDDKLKEGKEFKLQGQTEFQGLKIAIENRKGQVRRGVDNDGVKWQTKMFYPYGYIKGTEGVDGDDVDCYLGDNKESKKVFIIHQQDPETKKYDEDKVMLGFDTPEQARDAYLAHYDDYRFFGEITEMDIEKFKEKLNEKAGKMIKSQEPSNMFAKFFKAVKAMKVKDLQQMNMFAENHTKNEGEIVAKNGHSYEYKRSEKNPLVKRLFRADKEQTNMFDNSKKEDTGRAEAQQEQGQVKRPTTPTQQKPKVSDQLDMFGGSKEEKAKFDTAINNLHSLFAEGNKTDNTTQAKAEETPKASEVQTQKPINAEKPESADKEEVKQPENEEKPDDEREELRQMGKELSGKGREILKNVKEGDTIKSKTYGNVKVRKINTDKQGRPSSMSVTVLEGRYKDNKENILGGDIIPFKNLALKDMDIAYFANPEELKEEYEIIKQFKAEPKTDKETDPQHEDLVNKVFNNDDFMQAIQVNDYADAKHFLKEEVKGHSADLGYFDNAFWEKDNIEKEVKDIYNAFKQKHQVGDTININGRTYQLNKNHRWERVDKDENNNNLEETNLSEVGSDKRAGESDGGRSDSDIKGTSDKGRNDNEADQRHQNEIGSSTTNESGLSEPNDNPITDSTEDGLQRQHSGVGRHETPNEDVQDGRIRVGESNELEANDNGSGDGANVTGNYDLRGKDPLELSKSERRDINRKVKELIESGKKDLSEEDKELLRKYTGEGGLGTASKESLTQHYTGYKEIEAIFNAIDESGFKYEKVLEPAVGSGNFIGHRPDKDWTAVDIDTTNTEVAGRLYPDAEVFNTPYQDFNGKGYDLIVSNVPFLERLSGQEHALHDFYFLHSLDLVKENGVIAFVTSKGVMDKLDNSVREEIISKGDIIGAYRLPSSTFEKNAHTSVIADIIFVQKRPAEVTADLSKNKENNELFLNSTKTDDDIRLNNYFQEHPECVLGDMEAGIGQFGKMYKVEGEADLSKIQIDYKPYKVTKKATEEGEEKPKMSSKEFEQMASENGVRYYSSYHQKYYENVFRDNDGKLYVVDEEKGFYDTATKFKTYKEVTDEVIQDKYSHLSELQSLANRKQSGVDIDLSDVTDIIAIYKDKYSHPSKDKEFKKFFKDANDTRLFQELSSYFDENFEPKEVFTQQTRYEGSGKLNVDWNSDLHDRARANEDLQGIISIKDANFIAEDEATKLLQNGYSLIGDGILQNNALYFSGNVYTKIDEAESLLNQTKNDILRGKIEEQIAELENIKPVERELAKIGIKGNEGWFSPYASSIGINKSTDAEGKIEYTCRVQGVSWSDREVYEKYLNGKPYVKLSTTIDGKEVPFDNVKQKKLIQEAEESIQKVKDAIKDAIMEEPERANQLQHIYNKNFNGYVKPNYEHIINTTLKKYTDELPKGFALRKNQIEWVAKALYEGKGINAHDVGGGKAQPLTSKILTPKGWKLMGDMKVGDEIFAYDGTITKVTGVFPQGEKEIFEVTFNDGAKTHSCEEHLWKTKTYKERNYSTRAKKLNKSWECGEGKIRNLKEIKGTLIANHLGAKNHSIDMVGRIDFPQKQLPIDPYLLGLLIGDGCLRGNKVMFSTPDIELLDSILGILPDNMGIKKLAGNKYDYLLVSEDKNKNPLTAELRELNLMEKLSNDKFIPEIFKYTTFENRVALLQGLLDTDGTVAKEGTKVYYTTVSKQLADDIKDLVNSLGGTAQINTKIPKYTYNGEPKIGQLAYNLSVKLPSDILPFRLNKKAKRAIPKTKYKPIRYFTEVKSVGFQEAQCISIEHESHLYITDDYIVTHNTFSSIFLARVMKDKGISNKPLFVVPAKTIRKWERDIKRLYPDAKVFNLGNLTKENREKQLFDIANQNADFVLISHEGFGKLKLSKEEEMRYFEDYINEQMRDDGEKMKDRDKAKEITKIEEIRKVMEETPVDPRLTFDKLGFDSIVADEAHAFKNMGVHSKLSEFGAGKAFTMKDGKLGSARSYDFRFKANYITEKNNGKNVFMLTATPTPNKPMELFTMLRHLDTDLLSREYGINTDRDFANMFFEMGTILNPEKPKGNDKIVTEIKNGLALREMLNRYVDKIAMTQMNWIEVPKANMKMHYLKPSDGHIEMMEDVKNRVEKLSGRGKKGEDTLVGIYSTARSGAIDPRLYGGTHAGVKIQSRSYDKNSDKIENCLESVADTFKKNKEAGQLVFLDNAGHGSLKVNLHQEMKQELIKRGYKADEIAIISGQEITNPKTNRDIKATGDKLNMLKQDVVDAYNSGKIKVIIGTTKSMGEGMDIQVKTTDVHHLDIPYTPAEIIQRNGRAIRYGNENKEANLHFYITNGTFDSLSYNIVNKKKGWNEAMWDKEAQDRIDTKADFVGALPSEDEIRIELEQDPIKKRVMVRDLERNKFVKSLVQGKQYVSGEQRTLDQLKVHLENQNYKLTKYTAQVDDLKQKINIYKQDKMEVPEELKKQYADIKDWHRTTKQNVESMPKRIEKTKANLIQAEKEYKELHDEAMKFGKKYANANDVSELYSNDIIISEEEQQEAIRDHKLREEGIIEKSISVFGKVIHRQRIN